MAVDLIRKKTSFDSSQFACVKHCCKTANTCKYSLSRVFLLNVTENVPDSAISIQAALIIPYIKILGHEI